jgi:hypothetical protein
MADVNEIKAPAHEDTLPTEEPLPELANLDDFVHDWPSTSEGGEVDLAATVDHRRNKNPPIWPHGFEQRSGGSYPAPCPDDGALARPAVANTHCSVAPTWEGVSPSVQWDLGKSPRDRFCRILALSAEGDVLRVRARSQIARTGADFERFSEMSGTQED